jgi:hypothetical protein
MAANSNSWFPNTRSGRHRLIAQTTVFMTVGANRNAIGFESNSANGRWYDNAYSPKLNDYNAKYQTWETPSTSTVIARDNLADAETVFFPLYRQFYATVKSSPVVTNGQLEEMGFPARPSGIRMKHPVDKRFIDLNVIPSGNLVFLVAFQDRDSGKSAVPYYLTGAVIYCLVGDTPVSDQLLLTQSNLATRSPFEMVFAPVDRGKTVSIAARWQNRRGELGPWSEIVTAVIP